MILANIIDRLAGKLFSADFMWESMHDEPRIIRKSACVLMPDDVQCILLTFQHPYLKFCVSVNMVRQEESGSPSVDLCM